MSEFIFSGKHIRMDSLPHGVKKLILTRPDIRNAFHAEMICEITSALQLLASQANKQDVRLLIIEGEGKVFCAGADLNYMKEQAKKNQEENLEDARLLGKMFFQLASFPTPVICVVRGAAIGGGLGLTVCADYVLCTEKTIFMTSEVLLGIIPAVISPYIVRKIGLAQAAPFMLSGQKIESSSALQMGLTNKVTSEDTLSLELENIMNQFLLAGPEASRKTKELILNISPLPSPNLFEFCAAQIAKTRCSQEAQDGLNAFFDKQKPTWCKDL